MHTHHTTHHDHIQPTHHDHLHTPHHELTPQAIPHTEIRIDVRHDVPYCSTCKAVRPGPDKERTQKGRAGATLRNPPEAASRRTIKHRAQQIQSSTMRPR